MNIFQYLGKDEDFRTGNKVTQHVKHYDEVPVSKKNFPMYVQVKKDGVYALVVKKARSTRIFSRTGKKFSNCENLEMELETLSEVGMPSGVYIAELCNDNCSLEVLSGMVNPNRVNALSEDQRELMELSYLAYHDVLPIYAFLDGYSTTPYTVRLNQLSMGLPSKFEILGAIIVETETEIDNLLKAAIESGEEGIVIKQDEHWEAGHKGYRMMKKVRGVDYDLECIGAEEGEGKYKGLVANLLFNWKGETIKAMLGKGWTHDMAIDMWMYYGEVGPVGKIFQVYALQESSKGKLRLPKVGEMRHDKDEPD